LYAIGNPERLVYGERSNSNIFCVFSEILVVGTGDKIVRLSPDVQKHMKQNNILLEVQDTVS